MLGKAKERPQQVKQVLDVLKSQGPLQTYRAVMKKLDAWSPLGYSGVGEVMGVAPDVMGFKTGDIVACGGLTASHAEVVSVPVNLCVKLSSQNPNDWMILRSSVLLKLLLAGSGVEVQQFAVAGGKPGGYWLVLREMVKLWTSLGELGYHSVTGKLLGDWPLVQRARAWKIRPA